MNFFKRHEFYDDFHASCTVYFLLVNIDIPIFSVAIQICVSRIPVLVVKLSFLFSLTHFYLVEDTFVKVFVSSIWSFFGPGLACIGHSWFVNCMWLPAQLSCAMLCPSAVHISNKLYTFIHNLTLLNLFFLMVVMVCVVRLSIRNVSLVLCIFGNAFFIDGICNVLFKEFRKSCWKEKCDGGRNKWLNIYLYTQDIILKFPGYYTTSKVIWTEKLHCTGSHRYIIFRHTCRSSQ